MREKNGRIVTTEGKSSQSSRREKGPKRNTKAADLSMRRAREYAKGKSTTLREKDSKP